MMVGKLNYTCCSVEGCEVPGTVRNGKRWFTRGFCHIHYARFMKFGDPLHEPDYCPKGFDVGKHPLYPVWRTMKARTMNPNCPAYKDYGGRGISVCERWKGFKGFLNFLEDMGDRPTSKHSLDRIDNDGNYEPGNVRWGTQHQQTANQRSNNKTVGVAWHKRNDRWWAYIEVGGKRENLGFYKDYDMAVAARKAAELKHGIVYSNPKT